MNFLKCNETYLALVLIFILFSWSQAQTKTAHRIDTYVETISKRTKNTKQKIFANVSADGKKSNWKLFKTQKSLSAADNGNNLNESAVVWIKKGKISVATFTFQSPSRDWAQFATYYFRSNGTLAKIASNLNTFYGNVTVKRIYYFDSKGKIIKQNVEYFDLNSEKSLKINELKKEREFIDEKIKFFKNTNELPFIKLIS